MDTSPPNRWVRHAVAGIARTVLVTLVGLLIWTVLPATLGWQPTVVLSGSMEPAIRTGDVVLTREVPADALRPGHVLLVEDPSRPGSRLMHRLDHTDDDGGLVLRGDANEDADSAPVAAEDVRGVGIIRVPWVGLPYVWTGEGRYLAVTLTALGLLGLLALSPIRERAAPQGDEVDNDAEADGSPNDASSTPRAHVPGGRHAAMAGAGAAVLLVVGIAGHVGTSASAAFTSTVSLTATFTAADTLTPPVDPVAVGDPGSVGAGSTPTPGEPESIHETTQPVPPEVPADPEPSPTATEPAVGTAGPTPTEQTPATTVP